MCSPRWGWDGPAAFQAAHGTAAIGPGDQVSGPGWPAQCVLSPHFWGLGCPKRSDRGWGQGLCRQQGPTHTTPLGLGLGKRDVLEGFCSASGA